MSLKINQWKWDETRGFVTSSANWSFSEINQTSKALVAILSRTKWKSVETCLMRAWKIGLAVRYITPILSDYNQGGWGWDLGDAKIT